MTQELNPNTEARDFDDGQPEIGASYAQEEFVTPQSDFGSDYNKAPIGSLRDVLKKKVTLEHLSLDIPQRRGVAIIADPNLVNQQKIDMWANRSKSKKSISGTDSKKFAEYVLIGTIIGIKFNGEEARDSHGNSMTMTNVELQEMLGQKHPVLALNALIGVDGHLIQIANTVVEAAGYEQQDFDSVPVMPDDENPTY